MLICSVRVLGNELVVSERVEPWAFRINFVKQRSDGHRQLVAESQVADNVRSINQGVLVVHVIVGELDVHVALWCTYNTASQCVR